MKINGWAVLAVLSSATSLSLGLAADGRRHDTMRPLIYVKPLAAWSPTPRCVAPLPQFDDAKIDAQFDPQEDYSCGH